MKTIDASGLYNKHVIPPEDRVDVQRPMMSHTVLDDEDIRARICFAGNVQLVG